MLSRAVAYALSVRIGQALDDGGNASTRGPGTREVRLEQRPRTTVMPGMWELPTLARSGCPAEELRMTLRHAIMQVNYYVRIRTVFEDDVEAMTATGGERRWVPLREAEGMGLTGLARKVLIRAHLLPSAPLDRDCAVAGRERAVTCYLFDLIRNKDNVVRPYAAQPRIWQECIPQIGIRQSTNSAI